MQLCGGPLILRVPECGGVVEEALHERYGTYTHTHPQRRDERGRERGGDSEGEKKRDIPKSSKSHSILLRLFCSSVVVHSYSGFPNVAWLLKRSFHRAYSPCAVLTACSTSLFGGFDLFWICAYVCLCACVCACAWASHVCVPLCARACVCFSWS